jgi:hypothetical protein
MFNPDFEYDLVSTVSERLKTHLQYEHQHASEVIAETVLRLLIREAGFLASIEGFMNVISELEVHEGEIVLHLEKARDLYKNNPSLIRQESDRT